MTESKVVYTSCLFENWQVDESGKKCYIKNGVKFIYFEDMEDKQRIYHAKAYISKNIKADSPIERTLNEKLTSFRYPVLRQVYFRIDEKDYILDFFVPDMMLAFEADGKQHRANNEAIQYDKNRDNSFRTIGIETIRFDGRHIMRDDFIERIFLSDMMAAIVKVRIHPDTRFFDRMKRNQWSEFADQHLSDESIDAVYVVSNNWIGGLTFLERVIYSSVMYHYIMESIREFYKDRAAFGYNSNMDWVFRRGFVQFKFDWQYLIALSDYIGCDMDEMKSAILRFKSFGLLKQVHDEEYQIAVPSGFKGSWFVWIPRIENISTIGRVAYSLIAADSAKQDSEQGHSPKTRNCYHANLGKDTRNFTFIVKELVDAGIVVKVKPVGWHIKQ